MVAYFGNYLCAKCGWKSDLVSLGHLDAWNLKEALLNCVEEYKKEFGAKYLRKEFYAPFCCEKFKKETFPLAL